MRRHWHLMPVLALAGWLVQSTWAAGELPPRVNCVPSGAILLAELAKPEALLDLFLSQQVLDAVQKTSQYQKAADQPQFKQLQQVVKVAETSLGTDWQTAVRRLTGGGATLAVTPTGGTLLIVDAKDEQIPQQFHEFVLQMIRGAAQTQPSAMESKEYAGLKQWSLGQSFHVLAGKRLLLSNQEDLLHTAIDLQSGEGQSLASWAPYQSASQALGESATGSLLVNLHALRRHPGLKARLAEPNNPAATLLFASLIDAFKESNWLGLKLQVENHRLTLSAVMDQHSTAELSAFTMPQGDAGALPILAVPGEIACVSLYRDLRSFYAAKDTLFPERTSGLIFFENMMGIFFSGRQLTDEVFGEFQPEYRMVVATQKFDSATGQPEVKLPGFALIIRLRHPAEFKEVAEEAWQKALGLVSFTSGQKGQSGLIIDQDTYEGVKYHVARFTAPRTGDKDKLPMQHNFRPTLVLMDQNFILSSTEGLAKDLIVALKKESASRPVAGVNSLVQFDSVELAKVLESDRTHLVMQNMVEKGNAREQAEDEIGLLISLAKYLGQATLSMGTQDGKTVANLTINLNLP